MAGWLEKWGLKLTSAKVKVEVEVEAELGNNQIKKNGRKRTVIQNKKNNLVMRS